MGAWLDGQALVVGKLRRSGVGIVYAGLGYGLEQMLATDSVDSESRLTAQTYVSGREDLQRTGLSKEAVSVDGVGDHSINLESHCQHTG